MSESTAVLVETRATIEECARARAICLARERGITHPAVVALTRREQVSDHSVDQPLFVWHALLRAR